MEDMQNGRCATMRNTPVRKLMDLPGNKHEDQVLQHLASERLNSRGPRKTSPVWNFFHIDPKFTCRATCNICRKSVSRGQNVLQLSTSTLQRHLQTQHSKQWALACQVDGVAISETSDQFKATDCTEFYSSRIASPLSGPSILLHLEDNCVTDQDQLLLCASLPPETSNSHCSSPEPNHSFFVHRKEDRAAGHDLSSLKKKRKKEPFKLEKIQPNPIAFQDLKPVSIFPPGFVSGELEGCVLGQSSSLEPVLAPHKGATKSKSCVWKCFQVDSQCPSIATCTVCCRSLSRGRPGTPLGTSALQRHLMTKHPVHWSKVSGCIQTKHSTQRALACQVDGIAVSETSNLLNVDDCSRNVSQISGPSILPLLEDNCVTDLDQLLLCASEPPEISSSPPRSPEPTHRFFTNWEEDPAVGHDLSTWKKKRKKEPFKLEKTQPNQIAFQNVEPVNSSPPGFVPGELEGCVLGQNSSLEPVLAHPKQATRSKSLVWKFFLVDSQSPSKATCALCRKSVSRGRPGTPLGTSALQRHLMTKHPAHWSKVGECIDGSERLENSQRVSLPPLSAGVANANSVEAMLAESTTETSIPQCTGKLQAEQGSRTNEIFKSQPLLLTCDGRYALSVGELYRECQNLSSYHLKKEPVSLPNGVAKTKIHIGRFHRKQKHNTDKNRKLEQALLSSCADKGELCNDKLFRELEHWKNETSEPVTVLPNGENRKELCVGKLLGEQRKNNLKVEPGSWSTFAQSEAEPLGQSPTALGACYNTDDGDREHVLNNSYKAVPVWQPGKLLKPVPGKRQTLLWLFFCVDPQYPSRAICSVCDKSFRPGRQGTLLATSTLETHLRDKHPAQWDMVKKAAQQTKKAKHPSRLRKTFILSGSKGGIFNQSSQTVGNISGVTKQSQHQARKQEGSKMRPEVEPQTRPKKACHRGTSELTQLLQAKKPLKVLDSYRPANHDAISQVVANVGNDEDIADSSSSRISCERKKWLKSPVWNFFNKDPNVRSHATCIACKQSVSRGTSGTALGTSALLRHLMAKHPLHWNLIIETHEWPMQLMHSQSSTTQSAPLQDIFD